MIFEVEGDILKTKAQAIVHGIAPNDNFHHGLSLTLREQWPALYKDFRHYCQSRHPKAGELWSWKGAGGPMIVNLFTQEPAYDHGSKPGKSSAANVNHCLHALRKEIETQGLKSVAITRLATGLGGMKWEEVKPMIDATFKDLKVSVFVYSKFHAGMQAQENLT